jgi:hypothetical protein
MALHFIVSILVCFREESRWIADAMSSLPVPLSPVINTVPDEFAIFATDSRVFLIEVELPRISGKLCLQFEGK